MTLHTLNTVNDKHITDVKEKADFIIVVENDILSVLNIEEIIIIIKTEAKDIVACFSPTNK